MKLYFGFIYDFHFIFYNVYSFTSQVTRQLGVLQSRVYLGSLSFGLPVDITLGKLCWVKYGMPLKLKSPRTRRSVFLKGKRSYYETWQYIIWSYHKLIFMDHISRFINILNVIFLYHYIYLFVQLFQVSCDIRKGVLCWKHRAKFHWGGWNTNA